MDTKRLRHFLAIYETGSLSRAAELVFVTQPALTKSIRQLEDELQVKLFDRTPMGVVPTAFGEALAIHAKAVRAEMRLAETQIAMLRGASEGQVVVGITTSVAENLMPVATARLYAWRKGISLTVVVGTVEELIPSLRRGELDLALSGWADPSDPDLSSEIVFRDEVSVLASSRHPLASKSEIQFKDLLSFPWALPMQRMSWRSRLDRMFVDQGLAPPIASVLSNSASYLRALVLQGPFIGVLPHRLVRPDERAGHLVPLPVPGASIEVDITLTYRNRIAMSPAARALTAILRELIGAAEFAA
ncbi:LysR family transcriptional regulator [Variovorax sp. GT1P44]|uniref:LysR family transcriptional regulator n=1 Tax=Variovorax sp. GT1P44 TaxID=3443742 RepID=UPI003F44AC52